MTVKNFIEKLNQFPQDMEIMKLDGDGDILGMLNGNNIWGDNIIIPMEVMLDNGEEVILI